MTDSTDAASAAETLADPTALRDRPDVAVREAEREFPRETYEALADRYAELDGVVQIGLRRSDGAVLLQRHDESPQWHPPGDNVAPGQDWMAAAEETMTSLTGQPVAVEEPVLYGRQQFRPEDDPDGAEPVLAETVVFAASLVDAAASFEAEPTIAPDMDHPLYGDGDAIGLALAWFDEVPDEVDPNHAEEVELLLE